MSKTFFNKTNKSATELIFVIYKFKLQGYFHHCNIYI